MNYIEGADASGYSIRYSIGEAPGPQALFAALPGPGGPAPQISLARLGNGDLQVTFSGVLQDSPDLGGWGGRDPGADEPLRHPPGEPRHEKVLPRPRAVIVVGGTLAPKLRLPALTAWAGQTRGYSFLHEHAD